MTRYARNFWGEWSLCPPWLRLWFESMPAFAAAGVLSIIGYVRGGCSSLQVSRTVQAPTFILQIEKKKALLEDNPDECEKRKLWINFLLRPETVANNSDDNRIA